MHESSTPRTGLVRVVALAATFLAPGCELATHFGDYQHGGGSDLGVGDASFDGAPRDASDAARDTNTDAFGDANATTTDGGMFDGSSIDGGMGDGGPNTHHVMVTISGAGTGMVDAMGGALVCASGTCDWLVNDGTTLTVHGTPNATSTLSGWGGACSTTTVPSDCSLHVTGDLMLTATFDVRHVVLTVVVANPPGSVTAMQGSTNVLTCDGTSSPCMATLNAGATVTLTATPMMPNTEVAWAGATCSGTTCTATLNADTTITATFADARPTLSVTETGHGTVSTSDSVINCINGTGNCSSIYAIGTMVTLTETPEAGYTFNGWTGCDSMTATTCTITLAAHQRATVTANFTINHYMMTVHMGGTAGGTVTSSNPMLTCTSAVGTCTSSNIPYGTMVTLTAVPDSGSVFQGWSGIAACASSMSTTCTFNVTADVDVTAAFAPDTRTITVQVSGADGQITSSAAPFNCTYTSGSPSGTCMATLNVNSTFDLSVLVHTGYHVQSWSSSPFQINCTGNGTMCTGVVAPAIPSSGGTVTVHLAPINYVLDVNATAMTGGGTIQSTVGASTTMCTATAAGTDCPTSYPYGTMVTLQALPNSGSVFLGWGGGVCAGTNPSCVVTIDQAKSVSGTFSIPSTLLQVNTTNTATQNTGTVNSISPSAAINCGPTCSASFTVGTVVTLTATPAANYMFMGWSGAGCSGTGNCAVTIVNGSNIVTATFVPITEMLTVSTQSAPGSTCSGTISDGSGAINCGANCVASYNINTSVNLTQTPAAGCVFSSWSGCDSTTGGACQVTMSSARSVFATFATATAAINLNVHGTGTGGVTNTGGPLNCNVPSGASDTCSGNFAVGSTVTLNASPAAHTHVTWTGCSSSAGNSCTVMVTAAGTTVGASFDLDTFTVSVSGAGAGGSVRSAETPTPNINCPAANCSSTYTYNANVVLTATPSVGYTFTGWTGAPGCGSGTTCSFAVTSNVTATANFVQSVTLTMTLPASAAQAGSRVILPGGVQCTVQASSATVCSATVAPGTYLLTASPVPAYYGPIWPFSGCYGNGCNASITTSQTVSMSWGLTGNVVFATAATYNGIPGSTAGLGGADTICQNAASAAGIPNSLTFRAWLSTSSTNAISRLGTNDGIWVRTDGRPIAMFRGDLTGGNLIHAPMTDEHGMPIVSGNLLAWTGTTVGGIAAGATCNGWMANTASYLGMVGRITTTSGAWTNAPIGPQPCNSQAHLYCFMTGLSSTVTIAPPPPPPTPVYIFTSMGTGLGNVTLASMDATCQSEATAASLPGHYLALVSEATAPGVSAFARATMYGTLVRPDGWPVGPHDGTAFGSVLSGQQVPVNWNIYAGGTRPGAVQPWTGMSTSANSAGYTCNDWSSATSPAMGGVGDGSDTIIGAWANSSTQACGGASHPWYCIQYSP
jgi:uncharacterized repeat protein (TIGR02543 family)